VAFADALVEELDDSSKSLTTIEVILRLCHHNNWMISNGLAVLMNLTVKELEGVDIRRVVFDAGASDLCLCILDQSGSFGGKDITSYSFVRAAGLLARLSSLADVQEILQSPTAYQTLCRRLAKNATETVSADAPWVAEERGQLVRVIAAVRDLPPAAKNFGFSIKLPQLLVSLLPFPRLELNEITPTSVILPPMEPINGMLLGNIALSLLPYADDANHLADIYLSKSHGVERLICALATCADMRVRKNIAILLAKGCRNVEFKKKTEHFRGLQMIVELQNQLL